MSLRVILDHRESGVMKRLRKENERLRAGIKATLAQLEAFMNEANNHEESEESEESEEE